MSSFKDKAKRILWLELEPQILRYPGTKVDISKALDQLTQAHLEGIKEVFDHIAAMGRPYGQFKDWKSKDIANFFVALGEYEREQQTAQTPSTQPLDNASGERNE